MNICKRILLLFLLCVVLFAQYSPLHIVYATDDDMGLSTLDLTEEDITSGNANLTYYISYRNTSGSDSWLSSINFSDKITKTVKVPSDVASSGIQLGMNFSLQMNDNTRVIESGKFYDYEISGLISSFVLENTRFETLVNYSMIKNFITCSVFYVNENSQWVGSTDINVDECVDIRNNGTFNVTLKDIKAPVDAYRVIVTIRFNLVDAFGIPSNVDFSDINWVGNLTYGVNENSSFDFVIEDEELGLLNSIIEFLKSIWNGILDLPQNIANAIKGFFDMVVNAIVELGNTIINGIKNLFVPSEEDITVMKDKWEQLLADRFGALYQVTELIADYVEVFQASEKGTITFPSVTIPLAGSDFVFGGWEVRVVPEGFDVLFTALKSIISIVCTVWCVNGLKNRFERIVGGSSNI